MSDSARVLIVDDEPANRRLLADLVLREGYVAVSAAGGEEALRAIDRGGIDLVLLDLMMPGVDGLAVLTGLQNRQLLPSLPVLMVTAHDDRQARLDALAAGAIDFITKPIDRMEVACKIRLLIELKHLRDAATQDAAGARAQLQAVMDGVPDYVVSVDLAGVISYANRVPPRHFAGGFLGASWVSLGSSESGRQARKAALEEVLSSGVPAHLAYEEEGLDGARRYFECHLGPVCLGDEIVGATVVARDVTEIRRTEMHLLIADRMVSIGTLAAGVAHEINNPLAAMMANLELALEDRIFSAETTESTETDTRELHEQLRDAQECAQRIREIVRDLKLFSRAEEEERVQRVDVAQVLESTLRMAKNEIRHRARIVRDYQDRPYALGNESRLGQVFLNLIVNAAQAIPEGKADDNEIRVAVSLDQQGRVVVEVQDTGAGMPPEVLKRLFAPFFTTKPKGVGTGLGLSICHRIVTGLGGRIDVASDPGHGTTFRVILPAAPGDAIELTDLPQPVNSGLVPRGRILIIDDEPMIGHAVRRALEKEHEVIVLDHAAEALELLLGPELYADVVICDLMMPQVTGMDIYEQLNEAGHTEQAARIIFVTGGAFTQRAREFLDTVPNLVLEKPFRTAQLKDLVNERLGQTVPLATRAPETRGMAPSGTYLARSVETRNARRGPR